MADPTLFELVHSCPRCHRGPLFAGFMELAEVCSACGLVYEQEEGQMWGAMVVAYGLSALVAVPLFLGLLINRVPQLYAFAIPVAVLVLVSPVTVRLSRLLWTHAMYFLHREKAR